MQAATATSSDAFERVARIDIKALKVMPDGNAGTGLFSNTLRVRMTPSMQMRLVVMLRISHSHQMWKRWFGE